jgi:hypothetical protein
MIAQNMQEVDMQVMSEGLNRYRKVDGRICVFEDRSRIRQCRAFIRAVEMNILTLVLTF